MMSSLAMAELLQMARRPAAWIVGGVWLASVVFFAYGVPYLVYRTTVGDPSVSATNLEQMLDSLLPQGLAGHLVASYPLFGAAFMLILGALTIGNEYRWRTLGTLFIQGPGRSTILMAKAVALGIVLFVIAAGALVAAGACAIAIAGVEGRAVRLPGFGAIVAALAASWLAAVAFAAVGFTLALIFRNTAAALGGGLLWALALENAIGGLSALLPGLGAVRTILLGPSVGSLAAALGAPTQGNGGTPGVVDTAPPALAIAVLVVYVVGLLGAGIVTVRRRDVIS